ncbi:MAG: hypothetical protein RQ952_05620 [Thermoproteota archaeon]|nr:hypothetical protein [Thermoproteota archaeon]
MKREISLMIVTSLILIAYSSIVTLRTLSIWPDVSLPTCDSGSRCY